MSFSLQDFEPVSKSQLKKVSKIFVRDGYKAADKEKAADKGDQALEDAKKIVIEEDKTLPAAKKIKISAATENRGVRVKIFGWVHRLRRQGTIHNYLLNKKF